MRRGLWAVLVIVVAAGGMVAMILLPRRGMGSDADAAGDGSALWGAKTVLPEELPERTQFPVLLPRVVPAGWELEKVQVVWVVRDEMDLRLPARQAVRLLYRRGDSDDGFSLIEVAHVPGVEGRDNLWPVVSQGYFESDLSLHSLITTGTKAGVDYLIAGGALKTAGIEAVARSLAPPAR